MYYNVILLICVYEVRHITASGKVSYLLEWEIMPVFQHGCTDVKNLSTAPHFGPPEVYLCTLCSQ